ncbi:MAG: hypothetical protein KDK37_10130 [Leptospiraceae bacterium]|nr:hypothetical protein [Leptospiraceae bacterium]MCB1304628.1 hypothetical protein [Leptospiraceae bacterium]
MKNLLWLLPGLLLLIAACAEDTTVPDDEAMSQIYAAVNYKAKECGNEPAYILIVPHEPTQHSVDLCALTIIRSECPFNDYPLFCVEMYDVDIPGISP